MARNHEVQRKPFGYMHLGLVKPVAVYSSRTRHELGLYINIKLQSWVEHFNVGVPFSEQLYVGELRLFPSYRFFHRRLPLFFDMNFWFLFLFIHKHHFVAFCFLPVLIISREISFTFDTLNLRP